MRRAGLPRHVIAAKLARRCEVQLAYAIGVARPVSVMVDTFGTGVVPDSRLERGVREVFDLRPASIIADLKLRQPIYTPTAAYGHFGREPVRDSYADPDLRPRKVDFFTWERTSRVRDLLAAVKA